MKAFHVARGDAGVDGVFQLQQHAIGLLRQRAARGPDSKGELTETMRSLLGTILFHQAYHAGRTGILRRVAGKPGAIP